MTKKWPKTGIFGTPETPKSLDFHGFGQNLDFLRSGPKMAFLGVPGFYPFFGVLSDLRLAIFKGAKMQENESIYGFLENT